MILSSRFRAFALTPLTQELTLPVDWKRASPFAKGGNRTGSFGADSALWALPKGEGLNETALRKGVVAAEM